MYTYIEVICIRIYRSKTEVKHVNTYTYHIDVCMYTYIEVICIRIYRSKTEVKHVNTSARCLK